MSAAQYSPDSLEALLRNLSIAEDEPDHEEILKHANNVLRTAKGNHRALHTKIVALLNLDRHEDALRLLNSNDGRQIADLSAIERAYCLYKVGKLEEAAELTARAKVNGRKGRGLKHIAAQVVGRSASITALKPVLMLYSTTG
jgi:signal recognition particle subunit SRP72